jgi:hypothetical protein
MAQTRRRRQTKHRGNAAGIVEARGRTGRRPTTAEKDPKAKAREDARSKRTARYDNPPTWMGAAKRAGLAAGFMFVLALVVTKKPAVAVLLLAIGLVIYTPIGYYTDLYVYRRQQRKKAAGRA